MGGCDIDVLRGASGAITGIYGKGAYGIVDCIRVTISESVTLR